MLVALALTGTGPALLGIVNRLFADHFSLFTVTGTPGGLIFILGSERRIVDKFFHRTISGEAVGAAHPSPSQV